MKDIERSNVVGVRKSLEVLGAVVAEVDDQLRYVWIDNPHPDFDAKAVVGKRDADLLPEREAEQIMAFKREAFDREEAVSQIISFERSDGVRYYSLFAYPIRDLNGKMTALLTVGFDVPPPTVQGR